MITNVCINNFRCFKSTAVSDLRQTNLFTGKNNAGKTSLLEAIHAITSRNIISNTITIRKLVNYNLTGDDVYKNLTYKKNNENIEIKASFANYRYEECLFGFSNSSEPYFKVKSHDFTEFIASSFDRNFTSVFFLERKEQLPDLGNITSLYDSAEINGNSNIFLEAVKVIDQDIEELRTFSSHQNALFYRKKGDSSFYLIDYLGDASKKIITIIANIVFYFQKDSNAEKILLIDEIENGLHYSVHDEFWRILIELCIKYNIQLFATTHSKEMLESYCKQAEKFGESQAFFELTKNYNSEIISIHHNMSLLEYELQKDENVRG